MDYPQLSEMFKLTERRILQILATNHAFIKRDKEWEKEKRINRLHRWLKKDGKLRDSNKDPLEIQEQIRKEIEGDNSSDGKNVREKIIITRYGADPANEHTVKTISRHIPV